jgi:hypothetical protein
MHPELVYTAKARRAEEIRKAESSRLAKLARGNQPNRAAALLNNVVAFVKRVGAKRIESAQTGETPQIELNGEQS